MPQHRAFMKHFNIYVFQYCFGDKNWNVELSCQMFHMSTIDISLILEFELVHGASLPDLNLTESLFNGCIAQFDERCCLGVPACYLRVNHLCNTDMTSIQRQLGGSLV